MIKTYYDYLTGLILINSTSKYYFALISLQTCPAYFAGKNKDLTCNTIKGVPTPISLKIKVSKKRLVNKLPVQ